jgi:hypothetical protein
MTSRNQPELWLVVVEPGQESVEVTASELPLEGAGEVARGGARRHAGVPTRPVNPGSRWVRGRCAARSRSRSRASDVMPMSSRSRMAFCASLRGRLSRVRIGPSPCISGLHLARQYASMSPNSLSLRRNLPCCFQSRSFPARPTSTILKSACPDHRAPTLFSIHTAQRPRRLRSVKLGCAHVTLMRRYFVPPIGSGRIRSRRGSITATQPRSRSSAMASRFASTSATCWCARRSTPRRNSTTDGCAVRRSARRVPKSVSADTMTRPSCAADRRSRRRKPLASRSRVHGPRPGPQRSGQQRMKVKVRCRRGTPTSGVNHGRKVTHFQRLKTHPPGPAGPRRSRPKQAWPGGRAEAPGVSSRR